LSSQLWLNLFMGSFDSFGSFLLIIVWLCFTEIVGATGKEKVERNKASVCFSVCHADYFLVLMQGNNERKTVRKRTVFWYFMKPRVNKQDLHWYLYLVKQVS